MEVGMNELPKARLAWIRLRHMTPIGGRRAPWFAKFRNANAMFVWAGPLEIGWRMPWLERSARQLYPHLYPAVSGDMHVMPIGDLAEHAERDDCWCRPTRCEDEPSVVVHNSLDERETYENGRQLQ
jgi:hypothetical protein